MSKDSNSVFQAILTSSGILFLGLAFKLGLGFFGRLVIARFLGKVNYGSISLGMTLMMTSSVLVVMGTDNGVGRYLPRYDNPRQRRGVLLSAFQLVLPVAIVVGLVVAFFAEFIATYAFNAPGLTSALRIFGMTIPLAAFVRLTIGSIRGSQEALPRVYIENIALPVTRFVLIAVAVAIGFEAVGVAGAYAGAYGLATILSLSYLYRNTSLFDRGKAMTMHRELLGFSLPLMVSSAMNIILINLDMFMLGFLKSPGDVGIYNAAYPLANLLTILLTAFNFVFMPVISELHSKDKHDEIARTYQVVSKWIFITTLPIFLVLAFYPRFVIKMTFGPEYIAGGFALSILSFGFLTHTVVGPTGNTLMALGRSRLIMYDNILIAAVNTILNVVLIPRYSYVGAAIATTAGYVFMNGVYIVQLRREIGAHPFRTAIFRPGIAAVGIWVGYYLIGQAFLSTTSVALVTSLVLFCPLYVVVIIRFGGIEREEIELLGRFESRLGIDFDPLRDVAKRFVR